MTKERAVVFLRTFLTPGVTGMDNAGRFREEMGKKNPKERAVIVSCILGPACKDEFVKSDPLLWSLLLEDYGAIKVLMPWLRLPKAGRKQQTGA